MKTTVCIVMAIGAAVVLPVALRPAGAFEQRDLERIQERFSVLVRGPYAAGVSKAVLDMAPDQRGDGRRGNRSFDVTVYFVSDHFYDACFSLGMPADVTVEQTDEKVVFTGGRQTLSIGRDGVEYSSEEDFPEARDNVPICRILLNTIRFDGAKAWRDRGADGLTAWLVRPYELVRLPDEPVPPPVAASFAANGGVAPEYVIHTAEGLRTLWDFRLQVRGATKLGDARSAQLMGTGGIGMPTFYNTATMAAGGAVEFGLRFRVEPDADFPRPIPAAQATTMIDTHVHITTVTDLRDSALMARTHGFTYGLLSIYFREGEYDRHFLGDAHMFEAVERYPDVFTGFGFVQLNPTGYPGVPRPGPATPADIEELWRKGCKGFKTLCKWDKHTVQVDAPQFDPLYAKAAAYRMPVVFHTEPEETGSSHTRVAAVARRHPRSPMILAHLAAGQIDTTIMELKRTPNLFIQHMHLFSDKDKNQPRPPLQRLVEAGLADRIVFGSDVQTDHSSLVGQRQKLIRELERLGTPQDTIERIMHGNVREMLDAVVAAPQP